MSFIMSYNFIKDVALSLGRMQSNNYSTLYLLKYCYSEMTALKKLIVNKVNVINHP
jgi:hypothetical protein